MYGGCPPAIIALDAVAPVLPGLILAVDTSATSVQEVPSHCSTFATIGGYVFPVIISAEVCVPAPPPVALAVFNSATSVQEEPLYVSVFAVKVGGPVSPEKVIPAVCVPAAELKYLPVFNSATSVQLDPSQDATKALLGGPAPIDKAAVCVPAPAA